MRPLLLALVALPLAGCAPHGSPRRDTTKRARFAVLALLSLISAPSGVRAEPPNALDLRPPATPLPSTPWRFTERAARRGRDAADRIGAR